MLPLILFGVGIAILLSMSSKSQRKTLPPKSKTLKEDVEEEIVKEERKDSLSETLLRSPFQGVFDSAWSKYVKVQQRGKRLTKTPGAWGAWLLHPTALKDLNPLADRPEFQKEFFTSLENQYGWFKAHSALQGAAILSRYKEGYGIGRKIQLPGHVNRYTISLSGMLGVAHRIGMGGLEKWLTLEEERKPSTNEEFILTNGIF